MVMTYNVFGLSPDHETSLPNAGTNATVGGRVGDNAFVQGNTFGSTAAGLVLTGAAPDVLGNFFTPPGGTGSYSTAALVVEPGGGGARIGSHVSGGTNLFGGTAPGVPAILVKGADDVRVVSNCFGGLTCFLPPLTGPSIRITDGPSGATTSGGQIGEDDEAHRNTMIRTTGPAIEVSGERIGRRRGRERGPCGERLRPGQEPRLAVHRPAAGCPVRAAAALSTAGSSHRSSTARRPPGSPARRIRVRSCAFSSSGAPTRTTRTA